MKPLRITNIQRGCVFDGPGVRTTVFLKGCPLRCPWCCNPETISYEPQWYIEDEKCLKFKGLTSNLCSSCERLGGDSLVKNCPFGVCEPVFEDYDIEYLAEILVRDKSLFDETQGGVTFSGGEPLLQGNQLFPLLKILKDKGINIVLESTLIGSESTVKLIMPYVDSWIVDVKLQPQMNLDNGSYLKQISNMVHVLHPVNIFYRMVFVNEVLEKEEIVLRKYKHIGINRIEILCCHNLGQKKYEKLSIPFEANNTNIKMAYSFVDYLNRNGIFASLLSV